MKAKCSWIVNLGTISVIVVSGQSAVGFEVTVPIGNYKTIEYYTRGDKKFSTQLNPSLVQILPRGGTLEFLLTLNAQFPTWTFNTAPADLTGKFNIISYYACKPEIECGAEVNTKITGNTGAFINLIYEPGTGDPTPINNNLHWIQRVVNNHANGPGGGHGINDDKIDILASNTINPYYDNGAYAGEYYFADWPSRPDPDKSHTWSAELYLVEETAPQTVTIYNGIKWGWKNGTLVDMIF